MGKFLALLFIAFGLFMMGAGVVSLTREAPQCGQSTMQSSDTCDEVNLRTGHTTSRSANQQHDEDQTTGWGLLGFGTLVTGFGVLVIVTSIRMKRGWVPPQRL